MHFLLFWGFVVLLIATASFALWNITGFPPLTGNIYIYFSWFVDVMGFLAMVELAVLAYIRYVMRPDRLNDSKPLDGWILFLIFRNSLYRLYCGRATGGIADQTGYYHGRYRHETYCSQSAGSLPVCFPEELWKVCSAGIASCGGSTWLFPSCL